MIWWNVAEIWFFFEEMDIERSVGKNDGFWLLWGIFKEYDKQNIVTAVLRNLLNPVKPEMNTFLNTENLTNLIMENTCFKGADSCIDFIDLILRNSKYSFQYSSSVETGLSDHHHLIFSMMKTKLAHWSCLT